MKRKILFTLTLVVFLSTLIACATFKANTYKTMFALGSTYDACMKAAADLDKQGKLTAEKKAELLKIANVYYVSYQASVDAFELYLKIETKSNKEKLIIAIAQMVTNLDKLKDYLTRLGAIIGG